MFSLRSGTLHLIIGPMFCGKTTELIRLKTRAEIAGKKCIMIKYSKDTRYDQNDSVQTITLSTHDQRKAEAFNSEGNNLRKTIDFINHIGQYDCIFIDEIQFYEDGAEVCDQLATRGFEVVACGLQSDHLRQPFGCIPNLVSCAEKITHLTAIDAKTGGEASFTARLTAEKEQEVIGGADKYIAVDRFHYFQINQ
jgi:thymidine kinase